MGRVWMLMPPLMAERITGFGVALGRIATALRQVAGVPDYQRYVAHMRDSHPAVQPLGRDEFYRARLEERYNKPGARCC